MQQAKFLLLCGLVLQDSRDRVVFEKMEVCLVNQEVAFRKADIQQEEVSHAAERLLMTIQQPLMMSSSPNERPLTSLIMEAAMETEISRTFELASPETKAIYSLGGTDDSGNWMIRWMLWGKLARVAQ